MLFICGNLQAGSTVYKWRDENGLIHYSSTLPPEYVDQGHEKLNAAAIVVDQVAAPKTTEQLRAEEIARQRNQELLAAQEEKENLDRKLLATFRSEADIIRALEELVNFYQAEIGLARQARVSELKRLATQVHQAANLQRSAKPVNEKLTQTIFLIRASVAENDQKIWNIQKKMLLARESFDEDLQRYRELVKES